MFECGSLVHDARAPVASAVPPPVMFALPLSVQAAVALLFQRHSWLLMFPHSGARRGPPGRGCTTGERRPCGLLEDGAAFAPSRSHRSIEASSRGGSVERGPSRACAGSRKCSWTVTPWG